MSPFSWLPDWIFYGFAIVAALFGIALLFMPFSVFGIKPRLSEVELQLADLRAEIRAISLRLAAQRREADDVEYHAEPGPVAVSGEPMLPEGIEFYRRHDENAMSPTHGYMDPPSLTRRGTSVYEDSPVVHEPEQILRPTRFEPPAREGGWTRAPWEEGRRAHRQREELSPRYVDGERRGHRLGRAEPTLRWPPRPE